MRSKILLVVLFCNTCLSAQVRWTGSAGNNQWSDPANWIGNSLPLPGDDVLLDNSIATAAYVVILPASGATMVRTLNINPDPNAAITVKIPATNTSTPAFIAAGPGYGLSIRDHGYFYNSNGASSGSSIVVADSVRILDGGRYVHNTRSAHAGNILQVLSTAPGTEGGLIEFDVPGGAYTLSITNRNYGSLMLSALASGGSQAYNSIAANPCNIRGDLLLGDGVAWNIDLSTDMHIAGKVVEGSATWNLASQTASNHYRIAGDIVQAAGGIITNTGTGIPILALEGMEIQQLDLRGTITGKVGLRIDNSSGVSLAQPLLLPRRLDLTKGKLSTSNINLLTLGPLSTIGYDSLSGSFIEGPVRKLGLLNDNHFLFPVGKGTNQRWVALKAATGDITVEYVRADPTIVASGIAAGIDHISRLEYWAISSAAPASGKVELSFDNVNSGGVTDINFLRSAGLTGAAWQDLGSAVVTGSAGGSGSVLSTASVDFAQVRQFALASSVAAQNPLPVHFITLTAGRVPMGVALHWRLSDTVSIKQVSVERSENGRDFRSITRTNATAVGNLIDRSAGTNAMLYRVCLGIGQDCSAIVPLLAGPVPLMVSYSQVERRLRIDAGFDMQLQLRVVDVAGRVIGTQSIIVKKGTNYLDLPGILQAGNLYFVQLMGNTVLTTVKIIAG